MMRMIANTIKMQQPAYKSEKMQMHELSVNGPVPDFRDYTQF